MEREKITLTGAPETMLATLYGRALDSRRPNSVLNDVEAARAVSRIDYDFRKTRMKGTSAVGVAIRAKVLDDWTREFIAAYPSATVLHLACGLDTRAQRIAPPGTVRWVDLDLPDVVALRSRLIIPPGGDYRLVGASVTSGSWLDEVPADRPTVAVFEGLSMYLHKEDGKRLIERITGRFPTGQLLFDCYGSTGIKLQKLVPAVRNAGATLHWGLDDPREVEGWHPGLKCLDALRSVDMPGLEKLPLGGRLGLKVISKIPGLRDAGRILRYRF
ncbi:class I SAM-dependent methyltransferase [Kibdelosporangium persicum]|uniref:Tetracenomycin polyketide synthesis O-methyltransferase TcmP n=1 Tax=Kibdelosporangium persicum TaxID=2698649 RepID=A0ABX2EZM6_9PSEU|nr:class I SAM-dependent methyltransferase [Kibdelosporangium persicum]NRN64123.1 Tetracenomycin polyketide synthesis O-methyltransferase TcmP [Kibdelosporangium persicum]